MSVICHESVCLVTSNMWGENTSSWQLSPPPSRCPFLKKFGRVGWFTAWTELLHFPCEKPPPPQLWTPPYWDAESGYMPDMFQLQGRSRYHLVITPDDYQQLLGDYLTQNAGFSGSVNLR